MRFKRGPVLSVRLETVLTDSINLYTVPGRVLGSRDSYGPRVGGADRYFYLVTKLLFFFFFAFFGCPMAHEVPGPGLRSKPQL